jgi:hypothetical protein
MIAIVMRACVWLTYAFAINSGPVISAKSVVLVLTLGIALFQTISSSIIQKKRLSKKAAYG